VSEKTLDIKFILKIIRKYLASEKTLDTDVNFKRLVIIPQAPACSDSIRLLLVFAPWPGAGLQNCNKHAKLKLIKVKLTDKS
jgi:hypothetical protein